MLSVFSFFFFVDPWQINVQFHRFVSNDVWSECESVYNELVSASASDSVRVTSAVILSTVQQSMCHSSVYPQQDFDIQHRTTASRATRNCDLGRQLKVGPTHRVPAGVPATNGESRTSVILSHFTCH